MKFKWIIAGSLLGMWSRTVQKIAFRHQKARFCCNIHVLVCWNFKTWWWQWVWSVEWVSFYGCYHCQVKWGEMNKQRLNLGWWMDWWNIQETNKINICCTESGEIFIFRFKSFIWMYKVKENIHRALNATRHSNGIWCASEQPHHCHSTWGHTPASQHTAFLFLGYCIFSINITLTSFFVMHLVCATDVKGCSDARVRKVASVCVAP